MSKLSFYRQSRFTFTREVKKALGMKKKSDFSDVISDAFKKNKEFVLNYATLDSMMHELKWELEGSNVIFFEDAGVIDSLLSLKIEAKDFESIPLPHESFQCILPEGYEFKGVKISSFIFSRYLTTEFDNKIQIPFYKKNSLDLAEMKPCENMHEGNSWFLAQSDLKKESDIKIGQEPTYACIPESGVTDIIDTTEQSMKSISDEYGNLSGDGLFTQDQNTAMILSIKLVTAIAVYNIATSGQFLRDGLPKSLRDRSLKLNKDWGVDRRPITIQSNGNLNVSKSATVVRPFVRALTHEKYYKGEYKDIPIGMRYVFVRSHVRGVSITPQTQDVE